jgi:hypothetical protein
MADDNIVEFPGKGFHTGGGSSGDGMLEQRVARLEDDVKEIKSTLRGLEAKVNAIAEAVAEIKGRMSGLEMRLSAMPTTIQLVALLLTTWAAGAAIVFTIVRLAPK